MATTTATSAPTAANYQPEERSFELRNGLVITARHWRSSPSGSARDCRRFLAVHGFLDNASSFDLLAPLMLQKLGPEPVEIVALDLAGHGKSSHRQTEDYGLWRYVEDMDQIVEQLGWTEQGHAILGHSMGGAVSSIYAGLYQDRVKLCILLDNYGPFTRSVEDQPLHLLEHIAEKKNLVNKRLPFHPTIQSACVARTNGGNFAMELSSAQVLVPRGLRPMERIVQELGSDGESKVEVVQQGYTWSTDQILTIRSAQSLSEGYVKAFMSRITAPFLAVLASQGLGPLTEMLELRTTWLAQTKSVTKRIVPGNHSVHLDNASVVASEVCSWILAQDSAPKARL
ncbi:hypothetical protein EMPS_07006 [Entomortierella parvispora]|uniref:AB hydrolase-1 domain-containing protein n=1 Tax=Entomortierella parvispora TaxID=205924 RepID=A0A9P3LY16_9FUNG|nr:hypothetical protein EMPS_07006 [Entomortierella parvispora]